MKTRKHRSVRFMSLSVMLTITACRIPPGPGRRSPRPHRPALSTRFRSGHNTALDGHGSSS